MILADRTITISNDLRRWQELAQELERRIVAARVPPLIERLKSGEKLSFQVRTGPYLAPKDLRLTLSATGIQMNDGAIIPWEKIKMSAQADDWNSLIARIQTGGEPVTFMLENYPTLAYHVIRGYLDLQIKNLPPL